MLSPVLFALLTSSALISDVSAAPSKARAWTSWTKNAGPSAVYLTTNLQQNAVIALPVAEDGTLSAGTVTSTGGAGSTAINGASGQLQAPDALLSQSALTIAGNYLFSVNAGSNTLSMLAIDETDPTKLTLVGQPAQIPGDFPNTVAVSSKHQIACVAATGATNGVSCASFSSSGLGAMDGLRSFDLKQSTPPVGPPVTVSQVFFSEDESKLFATVKGDPTANNTGFFSVFPVGTSCCGKTATVAATDVRSSFAGTAVLFGSSNIPGTSSVFVTDASFGATILNVDPATNEASLVSKQAIAGQSATCWSTISPVTNSAFVADAGLDRLVEMSLSDASVLSQTNLTADGDSGLTDIQAAGNFIYALAPGNGSTPAAIAILDVSGGQGSAKEIQHFPLNGFGAHVQGITVL